MIRLKHRILSLLTASVSALSICLARPELSLRANALDGNEIRVCGIYVNDSNCDDVLGDGNVSYDAGSKTLHIKGILSGQIENSIMQGLTISVDEDCTLTCEIAAVVCFKDTTITGKGKLTVKTTAEGESCIHFQRESTLTVKDADIEVIGSARGITGWGQKNKLVISNSNVKASAADWAIGFFVKGIVLEDVKVVSPTGYSVKDGYFISGSSKATQVTIAADGKPRRLLGDVNKDGAVTADDAVIAARFAAGYGDYRSKYEAVLADMNQDGTVTADDAIIIARYAANYSDYREKYTVYV